MAVTNFLFGNRTPAGFTVEGVVELQADLTISESHQRSADVTTHPVESGATISDHVILQPERLSLEGFVTDTPAAVFAANEGRTQDAFDALEELWQEGGVVTVVTARKTYENMVIVDLQLPRERPSSMNFSMEMQNITVVETETAQIAGGGDAANASDQDTADLASQETDAGRQPAGAASSASGGQAQSVLGGLF